MIPMLMKAFARYHPEAIFLAPLLYVTEVADDSSLQLIAPVEEVKEEYYVIFAERMIQHPAVKIFVTQILLNCLNETFVIIYSWINFTI